MCGILTHLFFALQELLPFVTDGTDDEDEVLLALANSLGKLIPLVGGGSHAHTLLPPLELLLTVEENSVREAASASTKLVATTLPQETFLEKYVPMLGRLANKEWFTARISAAGLIADAYPRLKVLQQQEHLVMFAELCQDDTPMVRRVAAQSLGKMVENVVQASGRSSLEEGGMVTSILMPLYETLSSNEQPVSNNKSNETKKSATLACTNNCFVSKRWFQIGFCSAANDRKLCRLWPRNGKIGDRKWR